MGSVWADYDNDGDEDLFVYKWGAGLGSCSATRTAPPLSPCEKLAPGLGQFQLRHLVRL
ncbi:MAG: hypothetical protein R2751_11500 [Bacteroidales bacterium]